MKKFGVPYAFGILCLCTVINQSLAKLIGRSMEIDNGNLGGYRPVGTETEGVMLAANFAFVSALSLPSFVSTLQNPDDLMLNSNNFEFQVIDSSQQVVAGLNYKLTIAVFKDGVQNSNCVGGFKVIVYNQFGDLSVTRWVQMLSSNEVTDMIENDTSEGA